MEAPKSISVGVAAQGDKPQQQLTQPLDQEDNQPPTQAMEDTADMMRRASQRSVSGQSKAKLKLDSKLIDHGPNPMAGRCSVFLRLKRRHCRMEVQTGTSNNLSTACPL